MSNTGKGALSIAISDFLTNTGIGKIISSWLVDLFELHEQFFTSEYEPLFKYIGTIPGIDKYLNVNAILNHTPGHQEGLLEAATVVSKTTGDLIGAIMSPIGEEANYWVRSQVLNNRLPLDAIIRGYWRHPEDKEMLTKDVRDLGWNTDRLNVLTSLTIPRLSEGELYSLYLRGVIDKQAVIDELTKTGYLADDITKKLDLLAAIPGIGDLMQFANRMVNDESIAAKFKTDANLDAEIVQDAAKQGLAPEWVKRYWRAHWTIPSVSQGTEMLHRLRPGMTDEPFTDKDMLDLLKIGDYPTYWWNKFLQISYSPYARVDVRRLHKAGILSDNDVLQNYLDQGYDLEHATNLTNFTIKQDNESTNTKTEDYGNATLDMMKQSFNKGIIDQGEFSNYLKEANYDPNEAQIIINLAVLSKQIANAPYTLSQYIDDMKSIIVKAYVNREFSQLEASNLLASLGFTPSDTSHILGYSDLEYNNQQKDAEIKAIGDMFTTGLFNRSQVASALGSLNITGTQQNQIFSEFDKAVKYRNRRLTEAEYRSAYNKGFITEDDYKAAMIGLGYSDKDIDILVHLLLGK